jgi:hypothetical protein
MTNSGCEFRFWHFGHQNIERPFWVKRLTMPQQTAVRHPSHLPMSFITKLASN